MCIELFMKFRWMGFKQFSEHKRTMLKLTTLVIMIIEALVVLVRRDSHFRVTRALRPIFVIDNHYCGGIRRVLRQIIQSLKPIMDMLFLLLFFMMIFSIVGFYLFKDNPEDPVSYSLCRLHQFINIFISISSHVTKVLSTCLFYLQPLSTITIHKTTDINFYLVTSYPDVMMPAYASNRWSAIYFIAFLIIHLYFLMNLVRIFQFISLQLIKPVI